MLDHRRELWKSHAGVPSIEELTLTLQELAQRIAPHGTFNFLLSNGEGALWSHAYNQLWFFTERQHPFAAAQLSDEDLSVDFATETTPNDKVAVVVTAPLTSNETWTQFEPGVVNVFVDGRLVPRPICLPANKKGARSAPCAWVSKRFSPQLQ